MPDNRIGYLFPGQGAQFVGMGRDLYEPFPAAKKIFEEADSVLGYSLSRTCFEGPEEELTRTRIAQPAIFITSLAALKVFQEKFPHLKPAFAAGLSLGEFTALVAAGSLDFKEGLTLVKKRAEAMETAAANHPGTMASMIGLTPEQCEKIAEEAKCQVANFNSPDQTVLSGTAETIEKACQIAESRGAKRAMRLKVGGAFHSSLMQEAKDALKQALNSSRIQRTLVDPSHMRHHGQFPIGLIHGHLGPPFDLADLHGAPGPFIQQFHQPFVDGIDLVSPELYVHGFPCRYA